MYSWLVDGQSQLSQQSWWYRFNGAPEQPLAALGQPPQ